MKFTLIKDIKKDPLMRPLLQGFLLFCLLYLPSEIAVKYFTLGLDSHAVASTLYGNEELYIDPMSEASFLELWHVDIFFAMMLLFTLATLFIRLTNAARASVMLTKWLFICAFAALCFMPLAFYGDALFVHAYVAAFWLWHLIALWMVLRSFYELVRG